MARHAYRYSSGQETGFLVVFMVLAALIFLAVILSPVKAMSAPSVRESAAPLGPYPSHQEIPEVPVPGPTIKPEYQIKIF